MKAALLEGIEKLKIKEVPLPKCRQGQVLIKVAACGICRTDMKAYFRGQRDLHLPRVLGHEIVGVVAEVGRGVTQVKAGERVQIAPGLPCGSCKYCLSGLHQMCDAVQIMGFHYDGGFAEYVLVPANGVVHGVINKIPDHLTFAEATLTEPLACSVNMQDALRVGLGDSVVIFGAGPLGILNAKLARARGADVVILVEVNEKRMNSQVNRVFDYCINAAHSAAAENIMQITGGKGADVVIPCCPGPEAFADGLSAMAKRGRFGFFSGLLLGDHPLEADFNIIHYRELTVIGAYGCSALHNREAIDLMGSGAITVKEMISRRIPLEDVLPAIHSVARMEETKIVIDYSL